MAFAVLAVALALATLLGPTTQSGLKPAAGAIHITTSAAVGTVPHSQALATTATQQRSSLPGLSAFGARDTLVVALLAIAAAFAILGIAITRNAHFRDAEPTSSAERRDEFDHTLRSSSSTGESRRTRGLRAGLTSVMTAPALGSLVATRGTTT